MDVALKLAKLGERFVVVSADKQWSGRGKGNRVWFSNSLSLSFSLIVEGEILHKPSLLSILAGVIVKRGIISYLAIPLELKWPNDIMFKGKKLGGILGENWGDFVIIGIGLNVNNLEFPDNIKSAVSLRKILGKEIDKIELLKSIIREFSLDFEAFIRGDDSLISEWKKGCSSIGERVKVKSYNNIEDGIVVDITSEGALLVSINGKERRIYSSDELLIEG